MGLVTWTEKCTDVAVDQGAAGKNGKKLTPAKRKENHIAEVAKWGVRSATRLFAKIVGRRDMTDTMDCLKSNRCTLQTFTSLFHGFHYGG